MTRELAEAIADGTRRRSPVINLEDGQVWVSGMNTDAWWLASQILDAAAEAGYQTGVVHGDDAVRHGGVVVPVEGCEPIPDDVHREVFATDAA